MIKTIYTIGGYGFSEDAFSTALLSAGVDVFCDIRQRRGMRGRAFAFLNSARLQDRLGSIGIHYLHLKEFAPTDSIRARQKAVDARLGVQKRSREVLGCEFSASYRSEILRVHSQKEFLESLPTGALKPCLFCVERQHEACHRSLMSEWLGDDIHVPVIHLHP
jgi:uncharacterized protein (DUF488 family)